jgi:D-alanyl-D-alanine carboxypeptidase
MKTGFICDSGFNIVVSATRDGRKLVAVVLGEPSTRTRNARAAQLLENGFQRYFWKSLFGTSLDGLAVQAKLTDGPVHLREVICGPKPQQKRKRAVRKSKLAPAARSNDASTTRTAEFPSNILSATN